MFFNIIQTTFFATRHCQRILLTRVGRKNSKKTVFLKTIKIDRVNDFVHTIVSLKDFEVTSKDFVCREFDMLAGQDELHSDPQQAESLCCSSYFFCQAF